MKAGLKTVDSFRGVQATDARTPLMDPHSPRLGMPTPTPKTLVNSPMDTTLRAPQFGGGKPREARGPPGLPTGHRLQSLRERVNPQVPRGGVHKGPPELDARPRTPIQAQGLLVHMTIPLHIGFAERLTRDEKTPSRLRGQRRRRSRSLEGPRTRKPRQARGRDLH
eukprot:6423844-Alexandrium_andersonii.AAC.1